MVAALKRQLFLLKQGAVFLYSFVILTLVATSKRSHMRFNSKKSLLIVTLCTAMIAAQGFAQKQQDHDDEKPANLKVLPKDISGEDLHKVMKVFSTSLGVHCNYCHVAQKVEGQDRPHMDFASDDKQEKDVARDMMRMTASINRDFLPKMGDHTLEQITCVTCHNGHSTPIVSVDSLKK
jgi:hypothetical protein